MLELLNAPFPLISTERLFLRCVALTDAPEVLFLRSDEAIMKYIDREKMTTLEAAEQFIQKLLDGLAANEHVIWAITFKENPKIVIGHIGFWRLRKEHYRAEIGYLLHRDHWRKGIMKEALMTVLDYGFKKIKFHSIEAHINPNNLASAALLEKCGFVREAYFKEDFFYDGQFKDTAVYSILDRNAQ